MSTAAQARSENASATDSDDETHGVVGAVSAIMVRSDLLADTADRGRTLGRPVAGFAAFEAVTRHETQRLGLRLEDGRMAARTR